MSPISFNGPYPTIKEGNERVLKLIKIKVTSSNDAAGSNHWPKSKQLSR